MKCLRIYIDTSVVGGCLDEEFAKESTALFRMARNKDVCLLVSAVLVDELARAPVAVQDVITKMPGYAVERIELSREALDLQAEYLKAKVVGKDHGNDALHVALATVARADLIVSWNFKHIVHLDKIRGFNAVNLCEGYLPLDIRSPLEVV